MTQPTFVLASGSPRRLTLLRQVGLEPVVDPADVDETVAPGTTPAEAAASLARLKADVVAARHEPGTVVLGSDTIVAIGDDLLGKPESPAHAADMLRRLSGRTHQVHTGIAVVVAGSPLTSDAVVSTSVTLRALTDREIETYVATDEPHDKAGAYAIQGQAAVFVDRVDGDPSNVVGLPLATTTRLLAHHGIDVVSTWRTP
ncbi:MAG: Maf family protein [Acidimicrobiales bacterium]